MVTGSTSTGLPKRAQLLLLALTSIAALALTTGTADAQPPYEPNDSLLTGFGPLANNSTYTAALETENDVDFYYFYVTTPSTAQLTFTLTNLGGGEPYAELEGDVTDSHGDWVATIGSYIEPSDYATASVSLTAGKYYVEVDPEFSGEYGESYRLTTSGTDGAFGPYAAIAANCAAATAPVTTYQAQLAVAQARLKQAKARLRVAENSRSRRVRRKARAKYTHVKAVVAAEKASLKAAEAGQKPWCFIPA